MVTEYSYQSKFILLAHFYDSEVVCHVSLLLEIASQFVGCIDGIGLFA
jgi:hypothetical protein